MPRCQNAQVLRCCRNGHKQHSCHGCKARPLASGLRRSCQAASPGRTHQDGIESSEQFHRPCADLLIVGGKIAIASATPRTRRPPRGHPDNDTFLPWLQRLGQQRSKTRKPYAAATSPELDVALALSTKRITLSGRLRETWARSSMY